LAEVDADGCALGMARGGRKGAGSVHIKVTLMSFSATIVAVEKQ
jgi:hypothetical protein